MAEPAASGKGLKTNVGVVNRHDRVFKRGTLMFIEGETGREMFILRSGKVRILKQEGDRTVELAVLGPGSVLGELSLLDNQPRGATGQVIEEVMCTVIDEVTLESTLSKIPSWLVTVIKVVVSRLRETNKRNGDDIVKNNIASVISILFILNAKKLAQIDNQTVVPLDKLKEEVYSITGVGSGDTEKIVMILILKEMVVILQNTSAREFVRIVNPTMMQLYMSYLRVKLRGGKLLGEDISPAALEVIDFLLAAAAQSGRKQGDGRIQISIPQVELEIQKQGKGRFVNPEALHELISGGIIDKVPLTSAIAGSVEKGAVLLDDNKIRRVSMVCRYLPVFKSEVIF